MNADLPVYEELKELEITFGTFCRIKDRNGGLVFITMDKDMWGIKTMLKDVILYKSSSCWHLTRDKAKATRWKRLNLMKAIKR
jgi:hypothetical protein